MTTTTRIVFWSVGLSLLLVAPFAILYARGVLDFTDLTFYSTSSKFFSEQFWQGELYPRWISAYNAGLGAPVFFFYPPVTAYLTLPLQWLDSIDVDGIFRLIVGLAAATAISGITCYAWLSRWMDARSAFLGAIIYICIPFRLQYVYIDLNVAQCWALAWFPLILKELDRLIGDESYAIPRLSLSIALLAYTHITSCVVFFPMLPLVMLAFAPYQQWPKLICKLLLSFALGLSLACLYLIPLMENRDAIDLAVMQAGKYNYAMNFRHVGIRFSVPVLTVLTACIWMLTPKEEHKKLRVWTLLLAVYLFMMTSFSLPIWKIVTPLQFLQFPLIRLYAPLFVVLTVLFTHAFTRCLNDPYVQKQAYVIAGIFVAAHVFFVHAIYADVRGWPRPRTPQMLQMLQDVHDSRIVGAWEYRPLAVDPDVLAMASLLKWKKDHATSSPATLVSGEGKVNVTAWEPGHIALSAHITSPTATLLLNRLYFPGWSIYNGSEFLPIVPYPSGYYGFIEADIPRGDYALNIDLDRVRGVLKGKLLSMLAMAIILSWFLCEHRLRYHAGDKAEKIRGSTA